LIERGAAVPPELLADASLSTRHDDLRRGMVLSFTGIGAMAFAFTLRNHDGWGLGLLPLFAGLGYLITWRLGRRSESPSEHA
jgi:hypothetical protein